MMNLQLKQNHQKFSSQKYRGRLIDLQLPENHDFVAIEDRIELVPRKFCQSFENCFDGAIPTVILSTGNTHPSAYAPGGSNLCVALNKNCLLTHNLVTYSLQL